jgi:multidrug efflux system membrane fusion protein
MSVDLTPEVSGKVVKIYYPNGGWVKSGMPLLEIDHAPYEADLAQAKAQLAMDQAKLALHQSQLDRSGALASKDFVSRQDYDTYKANVEEAKARIEWDLATIDRRTIDCRRCTLTAPFDGLAGITSVEEGQVVSPSAPHSVVNVRQVQPLYVDFFLPEKHFLDIYQHWTVHQSLPVTVTSLDKSEIETEGEVIAIDNTVDDQTLNFKVRVRIPNQPLYFWPGHSVEVRVKIERQPSAVLVPENAVQLGQQGFYVFVVDGEQRAQMVPVTPGQVYDGWIVIQKGLEEGQTVVTDGHIMVEPGASVKIINP